jgi:L-aminopeptidase/D-esterase-like protein
MNHRCIHEIIWALAGCLVVGLTANAGSIVKPRARDLGVPFPGNPGPLNAITDVGGVEVGEVTLISGSGRLKVGSGPVRTGVTAILPRGKNAPLDPVFAGWFALNGNGEMTGTTWVEESGLLWGPIMITNTHSVGTVRDAVIAWSRMRYKIDVGDRWSLPVVAETDDSWLNDMDGFHVKPEHALAALDNAGSGPVPEGNVGGGTGMVCYQFKGGTGTASRRVQDPSGKFTVGVVVQANFGSRYQLTVAGVPVGREITDHPAYEDIASARSTGDLGSNIVVIATDAPLLPHQLKRLARRAAIGMAHTGSMASNESGDIFIAFSTANAGSGSPDGLPSIRMLPNDRLTPLFEAAAEATEEAIINALVAAETMTGANDRRAMALPHDRLTELLRKYKRLVPENAPAR